MACLFFGVQGKEEIFRGLDQIGLWKVPLRGRRNSAKDLNSRLVLPGFRESVESVQDFPYTRVHRSSLTGNWPRPSYQGAACATTAES